MADRYPLLFDLAGRPCLVVGGGAVATRKVGGLSGAGAAISVVAPRVSTAIAAAHAAGELTLHRRAFREEDVAGQVLVFAATSDPAVNRAVAAAGRRGGAWVNRADEPADCDFQLPASLRRGAVTVAVATDGASPALAAWLRDRVGAELPVAVAALADLVGALRRAAPAAPGVYRALLDSGVAEDLGRGDWPAVERKVVEHFGEGEAVRHLLRGLRPEGR